MPITIKTIACPDADVEVNGAALATVAAGGVVDVPVQYNDNTATGTISSGIVRVPDNRFNASNLIATGQTTSYTSNDDGDLQRGRSFATLPFNNPFGNTNRFTDSAGGQTYANNEVYDWGCADYVNRIVPIWYRVPNASNVTWATAMAGQPYTVNGVSTWYVPNRNELNSICKFEGSNHLLDYAPFNVNLNLAANITIITSTTNTGDPSNNLFRISMLAAEATTTRMNIVNGSKAGTNFRYILIRYASF